VESYGGIGFTAEKPVIRKWIEDGSKLMKDTCGRITFVYGGSLSATLTIPFRLQKSEIIEMDPNNYIGLSRGSVTRLLLSRLR